MGKNINRCSNTYIDSTKQKWAIGPKYNKLILTLKTSYAEESSLDKISTVHNDNLDSLCLLCKGVRFE
ncbi:MAG: hypothetical protein MRJ93_11305 [Nitrososphaeraceae archaeon]|nr:hypothetical protein [Nitrososphaeraceae archaeon]